MQFTKSNIHDEKIQFFTIDAFDSIGGVTGLYTTNRISDWKYGNGNWKENYKTLGSVFNITPSDMCTTYQTHTQTVRVMTRDNAGEGILVPTLVQDYDGIVTNEKNFLLCSFEADCVPIYFYDPVNKVIALSHSGWKGTAKVISKETVLVMEKSFASKPENIVVAIGPCACSDCYEVGPELIEQFEVNFKNHIKEIFIPKNAEKYNLNLTAAIEITLKEAGVKQENIFSVNKCTIESENLCSFRRTKSKTDHMLTAIMLK